MRPICFLSDFGLADDFVGSCKGVMLRIAREAPILDITHEVPGFDLEAGAEILEHATRYMPEDSVYLAVVDPGVGTVRRPLALETESGVLMVGPDNGLLIPAAQALGGVSRAVTLTNERYQVHPVSNTFHGRDIFSPAAAYLAANTELGSLGEQVDLSTLKNFGLPGAEEIGDGKDVLARIISIDRYGNARLSIFENEANLAYNTKLEVDTGDGNMTVRYAKTFGDAKTGELILVPDSHWRLSLAINKGNAAHALSLKVGDTVRLSLSDARA